MPFGTSDLAELFSPQVLDGLGVVGRAPGDDLRDDDQLGVLGLVVPDRAPGLRSDADRVAALQLEDLVVELELELARGDEVDLLLLLVAMAVRALATRVLRHPPVRECDLLRLEIAGHHPHLAGVVAEDVHDLLGVLDRVVGHLASSVAVSATLTRCRERSHNARATRPYVLSTNSGRPRSFQEICRRRNTHQRSSCPSRTSEWWAG